MPAKKTRQVPRAKAPFTFGTRKGSRAQGSARAPKGAAKGPQSREKLTQEALNTFIETGIRRGK